MLNLENLGVVELNAQEVQEIEGGFWKELWKALTGPNPTGNAHISD